MSKDFDGSAIIGEITEVEKAPQIRKANLKLFLNNKLQQHARIADMIYSVDEILLDLSKYTQLIPGDVVMTGTPAGVSAVKPGDLLVAQIDGLTELKVKITE